MVELSTRRRRSDTLESSLASQAPEHDENEERDGDFG
jgi:hypothetical protein